VLHHFFNLLRRSSQLAVSNMGMTILAIVAGLAYFAFKQIVRWRREGRKAVLRLSKERAWEAGVVVVFWVALFCYCIVQTVYTDHQDLVRANRELIETNKQLTAKSKAFDAAENEKPRRKAVRQQLGKFLLEASSISETTCKTGPTPACVSVQKHWETKVERYLQSNLEPQYEERFRSHMTSFGIPWEDIRGDMNELEAFIREIGD
jgi:hypothetical protein